MSGKSLLVVSFTDAATVAAVGAPGWLPTKLLWLFDKTSLPWAFCYQVSVGLKYKLNNKLHVC
jgi:hypothetical protein